MGVNKKVVGKKVIIDENKNKRQQSGTLDFVKAKERLVSSLS